MRLLLTRRWKHSESQSVFGTLTGPNASFITCEREWRNNEAGKSCVPANTFYLLKPHDGTKYKKTFALVGDTVSAGPGEVARYACVFHKATRGSQLQGCIALGNGVSLFRSRDPVLHGLTDGKAWIEDLREWTEPIYLTIEEDF